MVFRKGISLDVHPIKAFKDQNYHELKSIHNENFLFEDPFFPAINESLYHSKDCPDDIVWLRPKEVIENPKFVVNGFGRCDMDQGNLGNCWFIAACVGIMQSPKLFTKLVPPDQNFDESYSGIFHFRFWLYGEWVDVVVDDRLPFYSDGGFVFCSNKQEPNELWGPLFEKAYAKLYGSYENLDAGQTYDALVDMSGGVPECIDLKQMPFKEKTNFWNILKQSFDKGSIISCSINADNYTREAVQYNGLVKGHAYAVTNLMTVEDRYESVKKLIRIRNPWGNNVEWRGAWCDNSPEWYSLSEEKMKELEFCRCADGEFWMSFEDFINNWHLVQFCHLNLESFSEEQFQADDDSDLTWICTTYQSEWKTGFSAGGCGSLNQTKFWTNPQFIISLEDVDQDDDENMCTVIISLMQKDTRLKRITTGDDTNEEYIQFRFFRIINSLDIDNFNDCRVKLYANQLERVGSSGSYINSREVTKRFRVNPGNYLIIPSTYDQDRECDFMLRIYTEKVIETTDLNEDKENISQSEAFFVNDEAIAIDWINFIDERNNDQDESSYNDDAVESNFYINPMIKNKKHINDACFIM